MRQVLPKWQIATGVSTQRATLKPGSAPQKATLLTKNGPQDVSASTDYTRAWLGSCTSELQTESEFTVGYKFVLPRLPAVGRPA